MRPAGTGKTWTIRTRRLRGCTAACPSLCSCSCGPRPLPAVTHSRQDPGCNPTEPGLLPPPPLALPVCSALQSVSRPLWSSPHSPKSPSFLLFLLFPPSLPEEVRILMGFQSGRYCLPQGPPSSLLPGTLKSLLLLGLHSLQSSLFPVFL